MRLQEKAKEIPKNKRANPSLNIWGKTTDALKWSMDDEQTYIRDMFTNILTADINIDHKDKVQPAFIDIIQQLSTSDAQLLDKVFKAYPSVNLYEQRVYVRKVGQPKPSEHFMTRRYLATTEGNGEFLDDDFEKNLDNLKRLAIIREDDGCWGKSSVAKKFNSSGEWQSFSNDPTREPLVEIMQNRRLKVTDFGKDFLDVCFK